MAVAAGAKALKGFSAAVTLVERDSASLSTTGDDGIDDFLVGLGHCGGVALEVLGGKGGEDSTDGGHDRVPPSRD